MTSPRPAPASEVGARRHGSRVNASFRASARHAGASNGSAKYCVSCATFPSRNCMMLTVGTGRPSWKITYSVTHRSPEPSVRRISKRRSAGLCPRDSTTLRRPLKRSPDCGYSSSTSSR